MTREDLKTNYKMAGLKMSVSACSSQDRANRVENILNKSKGKWLCNANNICNKIEAEIQLSEATKIAFINIGNAGSAFIEILAGNSLWPLGMEYVTLLASTMLMSPAESKTGKNKERVRMFDKDSFVKGVADDEWDRIRVIIRQPYAGKKQFGLHFIDIIADNKLTNTNSSPDEKSRITSRQSLAEFKSKLQSTPPSTPSPNGRHLTSPSSRAASLVKAAQSNQMRPKLTTRESHLEKHTSMKIKHSPYKVDAKQRRKTNSSKRPTVRKIEEEVEWFLGTLDFERMPLEKITYKNLKEQMEEIRGSKLTREERKTFLNSVEKRVQEVVDKKNVSEKKTEQNSVFIDGPSSTKSYRSCSSIEIPNPLPRSSASPLLPPATPPQKSPATPPDFHLNSLHECPLCEKFFPLQNIEFHASICVGTTTRETIVLTSPTWDSEIEEIQIPEVKMPEVKIPEVEIPEVKVPEVKIPEIYSPLKTAFDLGLSDVLCPICNCLFPEARIQIHANTCADAGLLVS